MGLVYELIYLAVGEWGVGGEESGEDAVALQLCHFVGLRYELECHILGVGQVTVEVHSCHLGYLLRGCLFHPEHGEVGWELLRRHKHRSEYLAFTDILLPKKGRKIEH